VGRARARRPGRIEGLKVRIIDDPAASGAEVGQMLRTLAKMMIRAHEAAGDHTAIIPVTQASSTLTVLPHRSPDHDTNNEAA
jgi:hypothetical protein